MFPRRTLSVPPAWPASNRRAFGALRIAPMTMRRWPSRSRRQTETELGVDDLDYIDAVAKLDEKKKASGGVSRGMKRVEENFESAGAV